MARSMFDTSGLEVGVHVRAPHGSGIIVGITHATRLTAGYVRVLSGGTELVYRADDVELAGDS